VSTVSVVRDTFHGSSEIMRFSLRSLLLGVFSVGIFLCLIMPFFSQSKRMKICEKAEAVRSIRSRQEGAFINLSFDWDRQCFSWLVDVPRDGILSLYQDEWDEISLIDEFSTSKKLVDIPVIATESPFLLVLNLESDGFNLCINETIKNVRLSDSRIPNRQSGGDFFVGDRAGNGAALGKAVCLLGRNVELSHA
jgi:hypothetical protein